MIFDCASKLTTVAMPVNYLAANGGFFKINCLNFALTCPTAAFNFLVALTYHIL